MMKLSTKSRYGTRLMLDLAQNYNKGFIQLGDIAKRQGISMKYLEQIIIPLKKAHYVKSLRGAKGGHMLAKPPKTIKVGEIVGLLEEGMTVAACSENPASCERSGACLTRRLWKETGEAMYGKLNEVTLSDLLERGNTA
jgi:Rrf2 family protein